MSEKSWQQRANDSIAQQCTTYSKRYDQYIEGVYPTHVVDTDGLRVKCDDGKEYIDAGGLGSNLTCVFNNFSLPCVEEVILAEEIKTRVPCIEKLKFLKTGSAACEMAVRYARAYTHKNGVWWCGYHGTHDTFIGQEKPGAGIPKTEHSHKFPSLSSLVDYTKSPVLMTPALIIIEPIELEDSNERELQLTYLRKFCDTYKVVLCFDEIVTGWRVPGFTVSNYYKITPDLICLGKALGNGMPLSVLGGRASIMDNPDVFVSNTHNGEKASIREALTTIGRITEKDIDSLWMDGDITMDLFNEYAENFKIPIRLKGIPTRWTWEGEETAIAIFWQEMLERGWLLGKSIFPKFNWLWSSVFQIFIEHSRSVFEGWKDGYTLRGKLPRPVFKRYEQKENQ